MSVLCPLLSRAAPPLAEPGEARERGPTVDWERADQEVVDLLQGYLRVDTTNPPGHETRGAAYLADALAREGVPWEIVEELPGRGNLIARLPGRGDEAPLCLLSHLDVVGAEPASWPADRQPLSGALDDDGMLWGRGALDMKGMGALQTMVMVLLRRHQVPLRREVILLAVADEEVANQGMIHLVRDHWDEIGCSQLVNEGGFGLEGLFFEGQTVFPISVGDKGVLWVRMIASGEPGHGSTPTPDEAPERLVRALHRLERRRPRRHWHPELFQLLGAAARDRGGLAGAVLRRPGLAKLVLRPRIRHNPLIQAVLTDTVHLTGLGGAGEPNVVAGEAWANLDCRLQPGTTAEGLIAELVDLVDDPQVRFEVIQTFEAELSPVDDPLFHALATRAVEEFPGSVAGPTLSVGFTDSAFARQLGVHAYGLIPFVLSRDELATVHGTGERVSVDNLHRGLRVLFRAIRDVSAASDGEWIDPGEVATSPLGRH